ncbi:Hypothetical protein ORPV_251 [Orpheovirus IHUMI-LCC2]|uniref:Uncharacterized protein n=1 Tax=Orpheovirus IHUMI-LCC2 TaxID=2023057 RepID=A0A2I2L3M6_9VIRU|nr:Hypothetical protein ORPV_251 [Orpheovirus IHUMI-LCC2]SNW62155.1 Hypothetical protein ORPV_251 [Orpheovirus IHUMI-LCC2]
MNETNIDIINEEQKPGLFSRVLNAVWPFNFQSKQEPVGYGDIEVGERPRTPPTDMEIVNPLDLV